MSQKSNPERTCILTRRKLPKVEMIRLSVETMEQEARLVVGGNSGRGAYISKDPEIIADAIKKHKIEGILKLSRSLTQQEIMKIMALSSPPAVDTTGVD
jgi:uncharacterized protein